jgi:hypothetical protein
MLDYSHPMELFVMNYLHYFGVALIVFGLLGGFEWLAAITKIERINTITKDQFAVIIGITWVIIANL